MKYRDLRIVLPSIVSYLPIIGVMLLAAALPFRYGWVQRFALYWLAFTYPLDYILNRRWKSWHWTPDKWVYVTMILFFALTLLRHLFDTTEPTAYFRGQIEKRVTFLVVGFVGIMGWNTRIDTCRYVGCTMLLVAVGIVGYIGILEGIGIDIPAWEDSNRFLYNAISHQYVGAHMRIDLYQNIAIIFGLYLLHRTHSKWQIGLILASIFILALRLLCSNGRSGMLAMIVIVSVAVLFYLHKHTSKWGIAISVLVLALVGGVAVFQNERMNYESLQSESRLEIWDYTLREIEKHPFVGYGLSTTSTKYVANAYHDDDMQHYIEFVNNHPELDKQQCHSMAVVNPHNLYLQLTLESGLLSPLLFVLIFALAVVLCDSRKRFYMALVAFVILWQAVFDSFSPHFPPTLLCMSVWLMMLPEGRNTKDTNATILSDTPPCE